MAFKDKLGIVMKSKVVDITVLLLILIYAGIVFMNIVFEDTVEDSQTEILILELVILSLFLVELVLKIYAFRLPFLKDGWNVFDIIIVVICFVMT
jgi:voltage-gated sodium channel